jgi:mono/diheme cytochrome c family protein
VKAFQLLPVLLLSLLFIAFALSAQTPPSDGTLTANPVFQKNCAKCHGKMAEGRHFGGPSLVSEKIAASAGDLNSIITNGKGHMPKYAGKLTPEEINTLVEQIKDLHKK